MAKRIIEKGSTTFSCKCSECGTRFTYEKEDVRHNYAHGGDWVDCPLCGHSCRHVGNGESGAWGGCGYGDEKRRWSVRIPNPDESCWLDGNRCG
jgi:transcription elongation factor Elf1